MAEYRLSATTVVDAPARAVFAVLADPGKHPAIDGTGWVERALDDEPLRAVGQIFRMRMYHPNHPDGTYEMANQVRELVPPRSISWAPGYHDDDGALHFGGWTWRYDLVPAGRGRASVTLTYDWSEVPGPVRDHIGFPPFPPEHLGNSLARLAQLAAG